MGEHDERVLAGLLEAGVDDGRAGAVLADIDADDPTLLVFRTPAPTGPSTARIGPGDVVRVLIPDAEPWTLTLSHVEPAEPGFVVLVGLAAVDAPAQWELKFTTAAWFAGALTPARLSRGSVSRQIEWQRRNSKKRGRG